MTAPKTTHLAARLVQLKLAPGELAAIIRRPKDEVETWVAGDAEPDAEANVLLRIVMDPERSHAAELAAERVRHMRALPLKGGEDWQTAGIEPPYGGGHTGPTGGQPE